MPKLATPLTPNQTVKRSKSVHTFLFNIGFQRYLLDRFVEKGSQLLYDVEAEFQKFGTPSCSNYADQLFQATAIKYKLGQEFFEMRDVIAHSKNAWKALSSY